MKFLTLASVVSALVFGPATARAADSTHWNYRHFGWVDGGIMALSAGVTVTNTIFLVLDDEPRWSGGILFDDAVRTALRAETRSGRETARHVGDALYISGALLPTLVDDVGVTLVLRGASDVAGQMTLINLEAYSVAGLFLTSSERIIQRERPSGEPCRHDPNYEAFCKDPDRASSMISGHTGVVATSAGLICAHHQYLQLYGDPWADAGACAFGIALAVATGIARIANDRHYATDVITALMVGAGAGYVLPVATFYARGHRESAETTTSAAPLTFPLVSFASPF